MSFFVAASCLLLIYFFPANNAIQKYTAALFFFFLLPVFYAKIILRKNLAAFGLNLNNARRGLLYGAGMLVFLLIIGYILTKQPEFTNNYRLPGAVISNFWAFVFYEMILVNIMLFLQTFFFTGFVLFSSTKYLGRLSILAPAIVFSLFVLFSTNIEWKLAPIISILALGGIVSYKSRSFVYSYLAGLLFMFFLDAYIIFMLK